VAEATPTVIVDGLHIVYRVYGAGGDRGTASTALFRIIGRKTRPAIHEVRAIKGMSFIAYRGDAIGIIGRNGSGKSTLLRAIAGLLPPERGTVYTTCDASLLGVNAALLEDLTGKRNVELGCLAMGMTKKEIRAKYDGIVEFSGVGDFITMAMKHYSSGMGSRLRFAIAAARDYEILLIDEALATGDAEFRVKSHARIDELRKKAGTVFLVAHDLEEVEETCNRVIWLEAGKIVEQGEDVIGIIDRYLEASGGEKVTRDPVTRKRISAQEPATT
jgi:teichoic acid transport system ATP-binding protein